MVVISTGLPMRTPLGGALHMRNPLVGEGFGDFLRSANKYLRDTKIISKVARTLGDSGVPYAGMISRVAETLGYGRRRRRRGGAQTSLKGGRRRRRRTRR
jgi:hypothetical protein